MRYNPAPNWPKPPARWTPPPGWQPDPAWGPAPEGWQVWVDESRPWFKKKRFIFPIASLALMTGCTAALASGGGDESNDKTVTVAQPTETEDAAEREAAEKEVAEKEAAEQKEAEEKAAADEAAAAQKAAEEEAARAAAAEAERVAAEEAAAAEAAKGTLSQQNAYDSAQSYLAMTAFSRAGLLEQLTSEYGEGYPAADAEFAIARLEAESGVDWNAEAAESAKSYLEMTSFSRNGLLEQLTSEYGEGFTREQAEYGVSQAGL